MLYPAIDLSCFAIEAVVDIIMFTTILGIRFRDTRHPVIGLSMYFICGNLIGYIFPNAFGWVCLCLFSYLTMLYITKASPFYTLMAYIISYLYNAFCEDFFFMAFSKIGIQNENIIALGSSILLLLIAPVICHFVPLHRFFRYVIKGSALTRFLLLHLFAIYIIETGLYKYSSADISTYIPYIASFAVIIVITDIVLLHQQRTINRQQHDLASYETYQPMMTDLIHDILGRQHDFNNHLAAINMLPYTYKDYDSLVSALADYSANIVSDYRDSELLKINMPIVAGFIHSKLIIADRLGIKLDITIKNRDLVSAMPEYDIIRVAGILIDNALEASQRTDTVRLALGSSDGKIEIETLNKGQQLTHELRQQMFDAGYTSKKSDRKLHGYGLANLKKLVAQYNGQICLDNQQIDGVTYIHFDVRV